MGRSIPVLIAIVINSYYYNTNSNNPMGRSTPSPAKTLDFEAPPTERGGQMCIYIYIYTYIYTYYNNNNNKYVCMCMCVYIYIYIYVPHTYHIYIYIYMHIERERAVGIDGFQTGSGQTGFSQKGHDFP